MRTCRGFCGLFILLALSLPACAQTQAYQTASPSADPETAVKPTMDWNVFKEDVAAQAVKDGVSLEVVRTALRTLEPDPRVVELDQKQPEGKITFDTYVTRTLNDARVKKARALRERYRAELDAAAHYGVEPEVIVALWGIESSFGHDMGSYNVISSLATLAYEGRRAALFRRELIAALHILQDENLAPDDLEGSWAGAMGQCQFMPSTYRAHAVDATHDGHRDIWHNESDVFASIAAYLASEGWKSGQGWGREVTLSKAVPASELGLEVKHDLAAWSALGVRSLAGKPLTGARSASLIQPDGAEGRSFLVFDNFRAIMRWNRSTYFATTIGLFSDKIRAGSPKAGTR